ncbi:hypothetical protein TanjilG_21627 [Lupinus angustifolius]|uniref:Uncharacterized protein n=1 Tax=Lupinus angustifolius TaxID=3871 RepID=A0A4P1QV71_LUPAN|nr:PREDICTED: uncharacterized protein LOC109330184 [Lupinus angustifolius]OIV95237.1 hypothetical protein TanjilG_21627 [Lupinus angustifolius]
MTERKLNINAPLMSVRRNSATSPSLTEAKKKILDKRHTLPYYKSDKNLDQVTEYCAVPFNWEHIPGRCKGNGRSEPQPPKAVSITPIPRLPPGKSINSSKLPLEKESKVGKKFRPSNKSNSFVVSVVKIDRDKEIKNEKTVDKITYNVDKKDIDDGDVYSDALEALSHTRSFSMDCSISGVSGLDNLDPKKFGTFSTDQQTRDFMMSRFLPAAQAMTLQPPQYSTKKQSVLVEQQQPRDINKLVREEKKLLHNKHSIDMIPYTRQGQEEQESEEDKADGDADGFDNSSNIISAKGCGFLPHLHIRNSLNLLNPVPVMKMKNQVPLSSACEEMKPKKISHLRSFSPVPAVKKAWDAIHRSKSSSRAASPDMLEGRKNWTREPNRFTNSGELLSGRLSPFRRSRAAAAGVSPSRSKPQSPFRGARLPGESKDVHNNQSYKSKFHSTELGNIKEVLSQGVKRSSYSGSLTMEKTLYIDTASTIKQPASNLSSVDNKRRVDNVVEDLNKRRVKESNSTLESFQDINHIHALEEKDTLDSEVLSSIDANSIFSSMLHLKPKEDTYEGLKTDQDINQEHVEGAFGEDSKINNQQIVLAENPLPIPLPKSPSESWLWRALPLVSLKNSFFHSNQGTQSNTKRHDSNTTSSHIKWETMVKTSNLHRDHVRHSQELTVHKSKHSKS